MIKGKHTDSTTLAKILHALIQIPAKKGPDMGQCQLISLNTLEGTNGFWNSSLIGVSKNTHKKLGVSKNAFQHRN